MMESIGRSDVARLAHLHLPRPTGDDGDDDDDDPCGAELRRLCSLLCMTETMKRCLVVHPECCFSFIFEDN